MKTILQSRLRERTNGTTMKDALCTIAISVGAGLLWSCASAPNLIPSPTLAQDSVSELKSLPPLNEINSVEIGDNLYSEFRVTTTNSFTVMVVEEAYGEMDLGNKITIKAGTQGNLTRTWAAKHNALCFDFVTTGGLSGASHACLVDTAGAGAFGYAMFRNRDRYFPLLKPAKYTLTPRETAIVEDARDFKRTVLYQGLSKGTIKVSFRSSSRTWLDLPSHRTSPMTWKKTAQRQSRLRECESKC